jgi:DNA-binding protein HU-beta
MDINPLGGNKMNKSEFVASFSEKAGLSKKDAASAYDAFVATVTDALTSGEKVQLIGFGTFEVRQRAARVGLNPQTKEKIQIAASSVPAFKPGKAFKDVFKK